MTEADDKLRAAFNDLADQSMRQLRGLSVSLGAGTSLARFRNGRELDAVAALAGFTQEERDDLHRWARWLLGFTEGD